MIDSFNGSGSKAWESKAVEDTLLEISLENPADFEGVIEEDIEVIYTSSATALVKGASDVLVLDLRGKHSLVDYLVVCTGSNERHVRAVAEAIFEQVRGICGKRPTLSEGLKEGNWVLLDYGSILINVFDETTRSFYALERLWSDAQRREFSSKMLIGVRHGS